MLVKLIHFYFKKGKVNQDFALIGAEIHTVIKLALTFHKNIESDGRKMDDFTIVIHGKRKYLIGKGIPLNISFKKAPPMLELSSKEINVTDPRGKTISVAMFLLFHYDPFFLIDAPI